MPDLGLTHDMLTELFPQPQSAADWERYMLSEGQLRQFRDEGYLHGVRLLDDRQIDALREQLAEMVLPNHEGREFFYEYHSNESAAEQSTLFHALGAWRVRPAFHDILWNPAFAMAAYQLLGAPVRMFHDQLFSKPAKHGGVVAWHQDYSYWGWTKPMAHLTCWIGLDDVDTENGCMWYIPGSHRWGLLGKTGLAGDMDAVREVLTPGQIEDFDRKVPVEMKAGEASFHHPVLMHGSYANRSDRQRRATLINVLADGVRSNIAPETAPGTGSYPYVPPGERMGGNYYPLLVEPKAKFGAFFEKIPTVCSV
jgi:ectoine hydroxylase-related dioxygenase (phytanoyl-CoA dioxygenase family)